MRRCSTGRCQGRRTATHNTRAEQVGSGVQGVVLNKCC
jgi:hypothetical protein